MSVLFIGLFALAFWYAIPPFGIALCGVYFFDGLLFPRVVDSLICGISIVAQILLIKQYEEQWICWILVDVLGIIQWSGGSTLPLSANALVMYCLYLGNAIIGYYFWRKRGEEERKRGGGGEKEELKKFSEEKGFEGVVITTEL